MPRTHLVVIKEPNGSISTYPLKQWLRENPDNLPPGMHPDDNTSHELRRGLKKIGWRLQFTPIEVVVIRPDKLGDTSYADELIEEKEDQYGESIEQDFEDVGEITFGLEKDLQAALRSNIEQLEPGLSIIDGGTERSTRAGRIDIASKDSQGNIVVIELKAGRASSDVIAQVLSYMSTVAETEENPVRGMIVAGDFSERVILAAKAVPNLSLVKYSFQFSFKRIE
jgi:hypothetical protein